MAVAGICQKCAGFKSSYTCGCGETYMNHEMVVENREERESRGHPIGYDTPYQAMGGLTGFSSLAEGYMRLDPSGRGRRLCFNSQRSDVTYVTHRYHLVVVFTSISCCYPTALMLFCRAACV